MRRIDFHKEIDNYLALREAFGFKTFQSEPLLRKFADYLSSNCAGQVIRAEKVLTWVCSKQYSPSTQRVRLTTARMFLRHIKIFVPETEIPSLNTIATVRRPEPFIFSESQIKELLVSAEKLGRNCILEPLTFQTMISLMSCTGLRPGETIRLKRSHVFLEEKDPRLLIHCSKNSKSRWVLIHPSAVSHLRYYLESSTVKASNSDSFFVSKKLEPINRLTFWQVFRRLFKTTKITLRPGQLPPSPQSLRHSFAVNRLRQWYDDGLDAQGLLPNLSVYLGHVDPAASYWYISCTPDLMTSAAQRFENYIEGRLTK